MWGNILITGYCGIFDSIITASLCITAWLIACPVQVNFVFYIPILRWDGLWYLAVCLSNVYTTTEKRCFSESFHFWMQGILGHICGRYWKPVSQLLKYANNDPITYFRIPEAIFQGRALKFGTNGTLIVLATVGSRFCDNHKFIFLLIFSIAF